MEKNEIKSIIEAILFSMGDAVELKTLAQVLELNEAETRKIIDELIEDKNAPTSGVRIIEMDGAFQMCTKKEAYDYLIKIVQIPKNYRLTDVQLETLSIIAYKQPVTKAEIEKIRGVSSDHAVNRLLEAGLVEECGRMNTPGRPMLFATTQEFLRRFGLKNTEALPDINAEKVETFKMEAEEEIGYKLDGEEQADIESQILTGEEQTDIESRILTDDAQDDPESHVMEGEESDNPESRTPISEELENSESQMPDSEETEG